MSNSQSAFLKILFTSSLMVAVISATGPVIMIRLELAYPGMAWMANGHEYNSWLVLHRLSSVHFLMPLLFIGLVPYWMLRTFYGGFSSANQHGLFVLGSTLILIANLLLIVVSLPDIFPHFNSGPFGGRVIALVLVSVAMSCCGVILLCVSHLLVALNKLKLSTHSGSFVSIIAVLESGRSIFQYFKVYTTISPSKPFQFFTDFDAVPMSSTLTNLMDIPVFALVGLAIWLFHKASSMEFNLKTQLLAPCALALIAAFAFLVTSKVAQGNDRILHDTAYEDASMHMLMAAAPLFLLISTGWLYMTQNRVSFRVTLIWSGFAALVTALMFSVLRFGLALGLVGMPRRYGDYPDAFADHHFWLSVSTFALIGLSAAFVVTIIFARWHATRSG